MFDRDLIKIYKKYLKKLNQFDVFRDHLEHISERLGGKNKKNEPMKDPKDFGNLNGKVYTFGGDNFDLEEAYTLVRNLISDIKSWEPIKNLPQI
jgi:hypothetical protein